MCPFYMESFKLLFDVNLKHKQMEGLFHLIDADGSGEVKSKKRRHRLQLLNLNPTFFHSFLQLGFAEFVMFIVVVKQIEGQCNNEL